MEAVIKRKELLKAISVGGSMAGKNSVIPILNNIKLTIKNGIGRIISTDNEIYISSRFDVVSCDEEVSVCLSINDFSNAISSISEEHITLTFENNTCNITHSKGGISIHFGDSEEFPKPKLEETKNKLKIKNEVLYNLLNEAKNFTSTEVHLGNLGGVNIVFEPNQMYVAAINGLIAYYDHEPHYQEVEEVNTIIPNKAIPVILNMLKKADGVTISIGSSNIMFTSSTSTLVVKQLEGKFPNVRSVLHGDNTIMVTAKRDELIKSFNQCLLFSNKESKLIKMSVNENISLTAANLEQQTNCTSMCDCELWEGEEITIGVNGKFAESCLNCIKSDVVEIQMNNPNKPIILRDQERPNKVILLMPMML